MTESAQPPAPGIPPEVHADLDAWGKLVNELSADYHRESDRAAVVLAISRLDFELGEALKTLFVDDPLVAKKFDHGMFQHFGGRIDLAFCLGFLSKPLFDDMHALRKLRNRFAHHHRHADLSDAEARAILSRMRATSQILKHAAKDFRNACFVAVASALFVVRLNIRTKARPVVPQDAFWP
ncbi:MAG TPA: hypothetical protein VMF52_00110 [Steroidobacteraceae bacterium]|nr:hypothetical protein [Steroidobacteraceae bacterium]